MKVQVVSTLFTTSVLHLRSLLGTPGLMILDLQMGYEARLRLCEWVWTEESW